MKNPITTIYFATAKVLEKKNYKTWFFLLTAIFIAAYILLPVWLTPGNTPAFQISLLRPRDYILFLVLSAVTALLILMQAFLFLRSKKGRAGAVGQGGVGAFSAIAIASGRNTSVDRWLSAYGLIVVVVTGRLMKEVIPYNLNAVIAAAVLIHLVALVYVGFLDVFEERGPLKKTEAAQLRPFPSRI